MIYIGYETADKQTIIRDYMAGHDLHKLVIISPEAFPLPFAGADQVKFTDVIMYVTFYRLLQEIDDNTLVVINESLRLQNRYDLSYNCIRNFLNQTHHQLVFQRLPQIDTQEDFMILFDFATRSQWKRRRFDAGLIHDNAQVHVHPYALDFQPIPVPTSAATQRRYEAEKAKRFAELGAKDPHTIPRNLYLIGGKDKLSYIESGIHPGPCVARNQRLNTWRISTYDDVVAGQQYNIVEFPHRFIDFSDFLARTGQEHSNVYLADLRVDHWYLSRYQAWKNRIHETYASLQPNQRP